MELTEETFGKLQSRLEELEGQAAGPLREQARLHVMSAAAARTEHVTRRFTQESSLPLL